MGKITLGLICGFAFGLIDVAIMVPMKFDNSRKRAEALSDAFIERFMLGFRMPNISLDVHQAISGYCWAWVSAFQRQSLQECNCQSLESA